MQVSGAVLTGAVAAVPVGLLAGAAVHRSALLAGIGVVAALTVGLVALALRLREPGATRKAGEPGAIRAAGKPGEPGATRTAGEPGKPSAEDEIGDERHAEFHLHAWAAVGQVFMLLFVGLWVAQVVIDGEAVVVRGTGLQWIALLLLGGVIGGATVTWLRRTR